MSKIKIAFFDAKPYDQASFDAANQRFGFEIHYIPSHLNAETARLAEGCRVACCFVNDTIDSAVIDRFCGLGIELIALRCAGYNNVAFQKAYGRLHVVRVPAYSPHAVAEHAAALLLTLNRKTHKAYFRTRDNNFTIGGLMGFDLHGKTAGIIGTGKIGLAFVKIAKGFGMEVAAYDRYPNEAAAREYGFAYVELPELFSRADVISLHCPLTPETHHLINDQSIASMKQGVYVINTGRGQLIDTKALIQGLKTQKIGAAGLDVYEEENTYFFEDFSSEVITDDVLGRLLSFNNVLVTSHQGFFTKEALDNIAETTLTNIQEFFAKRHCANEVCYHCAHGAAGQCLRQRAGRCF